jgi:hypothetical protein
MSDDVEKKILSSVEDTTEGGILSNLWRKILKDLNITNKIPALVVMYLNKENMKSVKLKKKSKTSLVNDITSSNMTWKVFLNLIINLLNVNKMTFTVTLEFKNGEKSVHSIDVKTNRKD